MAEKLKKIVFISENIVINQLKRDSPKIAASFDRAIGDDLNRLSDLVGEVYDILA